VGFQILFKKAARTQTEFNPERKSMKTHALILTAAVLVLTLTPPASAQSQPSFHGPGDLALSGIDRLYVVVDIRQTTTPQLDPCDIEQSITNHLVEADIKVLKSDLDPLQSRMMEFIKKRFDPNGVRNLTLRRGEVPELAAEITLIRPGQSDQTVFCLQTSLARAVVLQGRDNITLKAPVWKTQPTLGLTSGETLHSVVAAAVAGQVQAFLKARKDADESAEHSPSSPAHMSPAKTAAHPTPTTKTAEYHYVASKNSTVFHLPGCSSVKRISPENLVGYQTRQEALNAGKRPCKLCTP
jgi:hypothetical protein